MMVLKLGADQAVNNPGLEARVRIAEGYRGSHIANIMETMLTRWISGELLGRREPNCMKAPALSPVS